MAFSRSRNAFALVIRGGRAAFSGAHAPHGPSGVGPVGPAWRLQRFFAELGPGLITGAAADDPSGISTYSVAGAAFGYAPLWTALFSFPLMAAVQLMCAFMTL